MNQSELPAIICNFLKVLRKSHLQGAISFGFASCWLKNGCKMFSQSQLQSNLVIIAFDSHFKPPFFKDYQALIFFGVLEVFP